MRSWAIDLALKIRNAKPGDLIVVDSAAKLELAKSAAKRLGKEGVAFELKEKENDHE